MEYQQPTNRNFAIVMACVTCGEDVTVVTDAGTTDHRQSCCAECQTMYADDSDDFLPLSVVQP